MQGLGVFCAGGVRSPTALRVAFVDAHRETYGVEPICREVPIAPSTYYAQKAMAAAPERLPVRLQRDQHLSVEIRRVWMENQEVYGAK